jgi:hypothetical protein
MNRALTVIWFLLAGLAGELTVFRSAAQNLPVTNALTVTQYWALAPLLQEFGDDALRLHAAKMHEGKLWLALRDTGYRMYFPPPPPRWIFRALDPGTMAPVRTFTGNFDDHSGLNGGFFDIHGDYLYVVLGPFKLRQINVRTGVEKDITILLPKNSEIRVIAHRSGVFIGSAERLLHIHAVNGKLSILASLRRRPAVNELDNRGWGTIAVLDDQEDSATFLFRQQQSYSTGRLDLKTMQWQLSETKKGSFLTASEGGTGDTRGESYQLAALLKDGTTIRPLLDGQKEESAWWQLSPAMPVTRGYPGASRGVPGSFSFDGQHLWFLFPAQQWQAGNPNGTLEKIPGADLILWHYDDQWLYPVGIPLSFPLKSPVLDSFRQPVLTAGPEGLLILARRDTGIEPEFHHLWFLPAAELDTWLAANLGSQQLTGRNADPLRVKHDKDQSGLLEPEELEAFKKDPEYLARQRKIDAQAFVSVHDRNGNKGIEPNELPVMDRYLHVKRGNGVGALHPTDLYHIADKNKDRMLDADELSWLHSPEFDYEKIRRTPTLPPSLQKFDVNKNGKLDPEEAAALKKHAEQMKR